MLEDPRQLYYVAVKLFLRDGDRLLVTKDIFGDWDLPGGRIRRDEFEVPLEAVVGRKVREELGLELKYELGKPAVFMRHERHEQILQGQPEVRIFAVGYEAKYVGGEPKLGDYHEKMEWVDVKTFDPTTCFAGGWLKGVQEYLELVRQNNTELM